MTGRASFDYTFRMRSPKKPGLIVYACGVATSALALWGVHLLNENGENIMGWYANGIIPAGALIVGVASGLGYAIGSRFLNVKLSKAFVWGMITTGLLDYVAAQYLTYLHILERYHVAPEAYTFVQYIREISETMAFKRSSSSEAGSALGAWGYLYKGLEMTGYALGSMLPSMLVFGMPYCKGCQSYLKSHKTARINSPELWPDIKKLPRKERLEALQNCINGVCGKAQEVANQIAALSLTDTVEVLDRLEPAANKKSAAHVMVALKKCPKCESHHVALTLINMTVDKKVAQTNVAVLDKPMALIEGLPA